MSQRFTNNTAITASAWAFSTAQPFSVCGWLYLVSSTAGDGDLFFSVPNPGDASINAIRLGYAGAATLRFRCGNGVTALNYTHPAAAGQWYHLTVTYDGTTARAYVDGAQVASQALAMTATHASHDCGDFSGGSQVAEYGSVKVWAGKCLSVGEIAVEKAFQAPQTAPAQLYAWWQYDNSAPTLDSSGHGHTLSGAGSENGSQTVPGAAPQTLMAAGALITSSQIQGVLNNQVPALLPVWFSDEPRITFTVHTPWTSNLNDSSI